MRQQVEMRKFWPRRQQGNRVWHFLASLLQKTGMFAAHNGERRPFVHQMFAHTSREFPNAIALTPLTVPLRTDDDIAEPDRIRDIPRNRLAFAPAHNKALAYR